MIIFFQKFWNEDFALKKSSKLHIENVTSDKKRISAELLNVACIFEIWNKKL